MFDKILKAWTFSPTVEIVIYISCIFRPTETPKNLKQTCLLFLDYSIVLKLKEILY